MPRLAPLLLLLATLAAAQSVPAPVVVELFTSEGCSSCPPADALLMQLEKQPIPGAEIVPLGLHVDYWNQLGWKDRFSSAQFSDRQRGYAARLNLESPYTPQMVVDGHVDVLGNDAKAVTRAITRAAAAAKPLTVSISRSADDAIQVSVTGAQRRPAEVLLAITETGLATHVGGGENHGRDLRHTAVVRALRRIGAIDNGHFAATAPLSLDPQWTRANLRCVVLVQEPHNGAILGAAIAALQ